MPKVVRVKDARGIRWRVSSASPPLPRRPDAGPAAAPQGARVEIIKKSPARIIFGAAISDGPRRVPVVVKIYRHANPASG